VSQTLSIPSSIFHAHNKPQATRDKEFVICKNNNNNKSMQQHVIVT